MNRKKFAFIIHKTDENLCNQLIESIQKIEVPNGYDVDILPVTGDEKFFVYDSAMKQNDAKYKIYVAKIFCRIFWKFLNLTKKSELSA